jgi:hypothetical protein
MPVNIIRKHVKVGAHLAEHIISEIESIASHHMDGDVDAT